MNAKDIVILGAARTAIGGFNGSLSAMSPAELGTHAAREAVVRAGVSAQDIDHAVFGHIIPTCSDDAYLARHISLNIGMDISTSAFNVNRLCGSSVQSVISAAQLLACGDAKTVLAGGAESMSRGLYALSGVRQGLRLGNSNVTDMTVATLSDPFDSGHMGMTAERIAEQFGITRDELDAYAVESHRRASFAMSQGYFAHQIIAVDAPKGRSTVKFDTDEHVRPGTTLEQMAALRPAFKKDGVVTAGNSSGLNDGAAALILTTLENAHELGSTPRARIVGYAFSGVDPKLMGLGPIPAVRKVLEKTGLSIADFDVIESNEAFAAQAIAVARELGLPSERVNPNGGAVAHGHPVGATGSIIIIKALAELVRIQGRYGLVTMCIGGGQGIALVIERV